VLLAKAAVLPAWMQLLHPFATIVAKSKLLVLPVYPAAWPQAKKHPLVQASFGLWHYVSGLYLARKLRNRYRQMERTAAAGRDVLREYAESAGFVRLGNIALGTLKRAGAAVTSGVRSAFLWLVEWLAAIPLFDEVLRRYRQRYGEVNQQREPLLSERVSNFYDRWSVKFTAKYYEDREREQAVKVPVKAEL
jgi:hypothetical protein